MKTKLLFLAAIFLSFNLTVKSATVEFVTITEAYNWASTADSSEAAIVKKLVITGQIAGNDYSEESEWSKFRTLNETFPNIEAVKILTDQDILDADTINFASLFYWEEYDDDGIFVGNSGSNWLKSFVAPNVKKIGSWAFRDCKELVSVSFLSATTIERWAFGYCWSLTTIDFSYFPNVTAIGEQAFYANRSLTNIFFPSAIETAWMSFGYCSNLISADFPELVTIGSMCFNICEALADINFPQVVEVEGLAFQRCYSLTSVDFPKVTTVGGMAFVNCDNIISINLPVVTKINSNAFLLGRDNNSISVSIGTGLEKETEIEFGIGVFDNKITPNADLTLGEFVLPLPDLEANTWQTDGWSNPVIPYVWKSITIYNSIEKVIKNHKVSIFPNPTSDFVTVSFDLEKPSHLEIDLYDIAGTKVKDIHSGFVSEQLFTKTISVGNLPVGTYFIKISTHKNYTIKKIIIK